MNGINYIDWSSVIQTNITVSIPAQVYTPPSWKLWQAICRHWKFSFQWLKNYLKKPKSSSNWYEGTMRFSFQIFATKNFKIFYLMSMFPNRTVWFSAILWFSICSESSCIQIRKVSYFSCSARYDALKSKHFHSYDFQGSWHGTKPKTFVLLDNNFWYKTIYSLKWHFTNFINLFSSIFFL